MGDLGVVNGPVPSGPNPHNNKPQGVLTPHPPPGMAAAPPQGLGVQPPHVAVVPHAQTIAPNAVPPAGFHITPMQVQAPAGPVNSAQVFVQPNHPGSKHEQISSPVIYPLPHQYRQELKLGVAPRIGSVICGGTSIPHQGYVAPHLQSFWNDRKKLWKDVGQIVVSSVLSIHNRSKLFRRALYGYLWQTMPAESWEIILVDDLSTEDLSETYKPLLGRINLRHVKFDHTRHPIFKDRNPGWKPGGKKNWFHTPALTINLGFHLARGPIISLCHPEILHAPENFELAAIRILGEEVYLFATTHLGTQESNQWLDKNPSWVNFGWKGFLDRVAAKNLQKYGRDELYWYTSFLPRIAGRTIGGVDFEYLNGVAGEDDDFRDRVGRAGFAPTWAPELEGFHQSHADESEAHRIRTTDTWKNGMARNRAVYEQRKRTNIYPAPANPQFDWTAKECFVEEIRWSVGSREPEIISSIS
jgi:hypothetical protein